VGAVILFGIPEDKDDEGSGAWAGDGIVQRALLALRPRFPELLLLTDVCLCEYTAHGHCGVLRDGGEVDNDASLELIVRTAVSHVEAGADIVAPSDMMDGRVMAIRKGLDQAGFTGTGIMAYSAKFASAYYGPFRDAVGSAQAAGTHLLSKATYQLNPANRRAAITEVILDTAEGADIIMVKPAGPYLDIIREVRLATRKPIAAYQVSGEYAQLHAAAKLGWLDLAKTRHESLIAIKRAGADMILTYFAKEMAKELGGR
jgi:porphobilinogen synthase